MLGLEKVYTVHRLTLLDCSEATEMVQAYQAGEHSL